jgi:hypothetical protein
MMSVFRGAKIGLCILSIFVLVVSIIGDEPVNNFSKKINSKNIVLKSNKINPNEDKFSKEKNNKNLNKYINTNNNFATQPPEKLASNAYDGLFKNSGKCKFLLVNEKSAAKETLLFYVTL